jgi:hypothetical protein
LGFRHLIGSRLRGGRRSGKVTRRVLAGIYAIVGEVRPMITMSSKPKFAGSACHPRWIEIRADWVALDVNFYTLNARSNHRLDLINKDR